MYIHTEQETTVASTALPELPVQIFNYIYQIVYHSLIQAGPLYIDNDLSRWKQLNILVFLEGFFMIM